MSFMGWFSPVQDPVQAHTLHVTIVVLHCENLVQLELCLPESCSPDGFRLELVKWRNVHAIWKAEIKAANTTLWRSLWLDVVTVGNRSVNDLKLVLALLSLVSRDASQLLTLLTNSGPGPTSRHLLVGPQRWQFHELSHHSPMSAGYAWLPILVTPFQILWLLCWPFTSPAPSKTV